MTKIRVEIEFDGPYGDDKEFGQENKAWLCAENIRLLLIKHTALQDAKVTELKMTYEQLVKEYPHYFEDVTGMGFGHNDKSGESFINVGSDSHLKVVLDKDGWVKEAYEGEWVRIDDETVWMRGKRVV